MQNKHNFFSFLGIPTFGEGGDPVGTKSQQSGQWGFIKYRPPKKSKYRPQIIDTALYRPNIDRKSSLKSAYLQNYTFRDKSTHVHNGSTLIYPISQEMHVKEDAGEYLHYFLISYTLSPVIYHITILGDFFYKFKLFLSPWRP